MSPFLKILILAVIQAIAEFLPISSSGHLAVLENLFGIRENETLALAVVLHAGTLMSIIFFYYRELFCLIEKNNHRTVLLVITGSIPAGIAGILLKKTGIAEVIFNNLFAVGIGFIITATLLRFGMRCREGAKYIRELTVFETIIIGVYQALAIMPGISRSGSTIIGSVSSGLKRSEAATYTFFLAIPAIAGASLLELMSALKHMPEGISNDLPFGYMLTGFVVSAIIGYMALGILLNSLRKGNLNIYSNYCYLIGTVVLVWQIAALFK